MNLKVKIVNKYKVLLFNLIICTAALIIGLHSHGDLPQGGGGGPGVRLSPARDCGLLARVVWVARVLGEGGQAHRGGGGGEGDGGGEGEEGDVEVQAGVGETLVVPDAGHSVPGRGDTVHDVVLPHQHLE